MKVRELIEKLSVYNPEAVVSVRVDDINAWLEKVRGVDAGTVELVVSTEEED